MTSRKQIKEAMNKRVKERGKVKKADTARRGEEKEIENMTELNIIAVP